MEMERTRRSMDRSRELAVKKPRLSEEAERDRGANSVVPARERAVPSRASGGGGGSGQAVVDPRFRVVERQREGREDSGRGGGAPYQQQQQQMQELVAEYKTALAELIFNSKPIITNLTIIAGENIHAAKGIAATVCAHILEVPSDQKLPSLYLLDSIVKNIGRDYIKYFAAKLPEVFCKAYKQVDSSIHPGMRHLYGTWKGVFPPAPLQLIEKELFSPAVNNSSSKGTDSQSASQTRPSHSIHVNPKYLEARQRLQQSSHPKITSNESMDSSINSAEDTVRSDRTSSTGNARPWADTSVVQSVQYPLKELVSEPSRKSSSLGERDLEYLTDIPQYSDTMIGRTNKRVMERSGLDNSPYGTGVSDLETSAEQRNGFDFPRAKYKEIRSSQILGQQLPNNQSGILKSNQVSLRNWKNSEEEEYMWDDMSSKFTDHAENIDQWKGERNSEDSEKHVNVGRSKWTYSNKFHGSQMEKTLGEERFPPAMDFEEKISHSRNQSDGHLVAHRDSYSDSLFTEESMLRPRSSSARLHQEPPSATSFNLTNVASRISSKLEAPQAPFSSGLSMSLKSSLPNSGLMPHLGLSVGAAPSSLGASSSSNSSPPTATFQHLKSHLPSLDHHKSQLVPQSNQIQMQNSGQFHRPLSSKVASHSFPARPSSHILPSQQNLQPAVSQNLHIVETSSPYAPFTDLQDRLPSMHQSHYDQPLPPKETQSQLSNERGRSFSLGMSAQFGGSVTPTNPAAETPVQSSAADLLTAIMKSRLVSSNPVDLQSPNLQPPLPGGPPPVQAAVPSIPTIQPSPDSGPNSCSNTLPLETNRGRTVNPPLPPGPPPHSSLISQLTSSVDANLNPLSSLLNSLVAKGIISSQGSQTQTKDVIESNNTAEISNQLPSKTTQFSASNPNAVFSVIDGLPTPSSANELSLAEATEPEEDLKDLIGFEFRPEVIRHLHTVVINALFDDLKHQCRKCGLRFRHQEQLDKHLRSHDSTKLELASQASRKWFANLSDFFSRSLPGQLGSMDANILEATASDIARSEPMVPADERQCICAFCGEPFEDVYCHIRDMWMYKGTVYMTIAGGKQNVGSADWDATSGLIVHAKCMPESSRDGL